MPKNKSNIVSNPLTSAFKNMTLKLVAPLSPRGEDEDSSQKRAFDYYNEGKNLLLHGCSGTGKSFVAIYLALNQLIRRKGDQQRLVIIRSAVPTRDVGFLPGLLQEKIAVYEAPYKDIFTELFDRGDAYESLQKHGVVEFMSTSFIRGITLNDAIIIVDEIANMSFHELDGLITRVGKNSRIMLCGDFYQSDLNKKEAQGVLRFMDIVKSMEEFAHVEFGPEDIVRSGLVKSYIQKKIEMGYE